MILAIKIILGLVVFYCACLYVPHFKCITSCRWKTYRFKKANEVLYSIDEQKPDLSKFSKKQLIKLYERSTPFGCRSLTIKDAHTKIREVIKNTIAERELLED